MHAEAVMVLMDDASRQASGADAQHQQQQQQRKLDHSHRRPRSAPVVVMPMAAVIDDAACQAETGEGQKKSKRQSFHQGLLFPLPRG